MTVTTDINAPAESSVTDRRRPGRMEHVDPSLIPILRTGELPSDLDAGLEFDETDQAAGARGVFFGVALSIPLWVGIVYVGRWLLS